MKFTNRIDAGQQLAKALSGYKNDPLAVVVALPRGGVPVAHPIAKSLGLPLDIVVPRKIGAPFNQEFAIGAIMEDKKGYFNDDTIRALRVPREYIDMEIEKEAKEAQRRLRVYRGDRSPQDFSGKTVIIVDDGIATGATMRASIASIRSKNPKQIVVAVPVGPADTLREIAAIAEKVVCLSSPNPFQAVGNFYHNFGQTEDEEVIKRMSDPEIKS